MYFLNEMFSGSMPDRMDTNDFIQFGCDDIFFFSIRER